MNNPYFKEFPEVSFEVDEGSTDAHKCMIDGEVYLNIGDVEFVRYEDFDLILLAGIKMGMQISLMRKDNIPPEEED